MNNTSDVTAESSEDDDKYTSTNDESPPRHLAKIDVPLFASISQAKSSHSRKTTGSYVQFENKIDDLVMKRNKRDIAFPSWRESIPVIALKPRAKIPTNSAWSNRPLKSVVKPELFVPSLNELNKEDNDVESYSSSPIAFMRISEPMTVTRHSSFPLKLTSPTTTVQNRVLGTPPRWKDEFPPAISTSNGSKRSLSELSSSPFLSINESTNFSPPSKKLVTVANTAVDRRSNKTLTPPFTPGALVSKPRPIRQQQQQQHHDHDHDPTRDEERIDQSLHGLPVKTNTTISLSASSAFSLTL
jgi:hypothetical protein